MADRVLTIEIGSKITKVSETDYKGSPAVYNYFSFDTPADMVENQIISENELFKTTLEELLHRHNIRTRKVVFVISTIGIGTKEETVPVMKDARMQDFIKTNLSSFFPVDSKDCHVAFRVNGTTAEGKNRVQLYAVNNNIIYSYQALALFCKLNLVDMVFSENGIAQSLREIYPKGKAVNVNVEDDHASITIIRDGEVALQRSIAYGLDDSIRAIQESDAYGQNLTYYEAFERMCESDCIYHSFAEMADDAEGSRVKEEATEGLRYMVSNVSRILEYYQSQHQGETFDRLTFSGLGSGCKGLMKLFRNETGYAFERIESETVGKIAKNLDEMIFCIAFPAAAASAVSKGLLPKKKAFDLEQMMKQPDDNSTARKLFAGCVIISLILIVVPVARRIILNGQKASLEASIASMQEAKKVNDEYQATKTKYEELLNMYDMTTTPNDAFLTLLGEMETGIPTDAVIEEMSASKESVTIYFNVPSKTVAAKTMQAFREFSSVEQVSVDALEAEEETEEDAVTSYHFTVTCYYPGSTETQTEENETEDDVTESGEEDAQ